MTGREAVGERGAFRVVDAFEEAVARYTGAPYAVAVDSATNGLFLSLLYWKRAYWWDRAGYVGPYVNLPKRTYVGVAQAARNAGYDVGWRDEPWAGMYQLQPIPVWDCAKRFMSGMARHLRGSFMVVSFQAGKILPIGRGGAILTDSAEAVAWLKRARFDGRTEGARCDEPDRITAPGWHCYMTPPDAARGLWLLTYLPEHNPDQVDTYDDLSALEAFQ